MWTDARSSLTDSDQAIANAPGAVLLDLPHYTGGLTSELQGKAGLAFPDVKTSPYAGSQISVRKDRIT